jgi:hypothetical protein
MDNKYEVFIQLLNFNRDKYSAEKVFKDFISLFAISLSNKVSFNQENCEMYEKIYQSYEKEEQFNFYALSSELTKLFCNEKEPYDILGEIYQKITNKNYLRLINNNPLQEVGKKLQGVININKKAKNGKMIEMNCGSGAMILAYASTLKMFKLDYKFDLEVTAIDTDIINVFMTYIQLYFFEIAAVVILVDENNKELMRLYTPAYEDYEENLMVA